MPCSIGPIFSERTFQTDTAPAQTPSLHPLSWDTVAVECYTLPLREVKNALHLNFYSIFVDWFSKLRRLQYYRRKSLRGLLWCADQYRQVEL